MLWAGLALLGAVLDAGYYALAKRFLATVEDEVLASGGFLAASALLFLLSLARGIPPVSPALLPAVAITGTINIVAALLVFRALRTTDLSLAVPFITFTLVFLMGSSYLLLGEVPTAPGIAGILFIVLGAFLIQLPRGRPGDRTHREGILLMILVAFLYSLSLPFDKAVVLASDPVFGSALVCLYVGGILGGVAVARGCSGRTTGSAALSAAIAVGLVLTGEVVAINLAYLLQIVPYVIAVKRLSILFSVLIGALAFREGGLRFRLPGALVMLGGVTLIVLTTGPGP